MVRDAAVAVLVAEERLARGVRPHGARELLLDAAAADVARESAADPGVPVGAQELAYVVYTSGSTGTPKGVAVPHRAVVRLARGGSWVRLDAGETVLQLAPVAFDASTFEIWGALLNGARLVVFPAGTPSPAELGAELERTGVSTLWLTAGLFHQMVDAQLDSLRGVRQLVAGGDSLSAAHVRRVVEGVAGCRVINGYGPTENTTFSTTYAVPDAGPPGAGVPIGRPVENSTAYVLDRWAAPVPAGVAGELYVGGDGVARGYLDRPAATAERFVPDPFSPEAGARLYRTGDRVRWTAAGVLEFLGRTDDQVKIRGFRVEPGEVGAALARHPRVRDAVAVVRGDGAGERRLVAYAVAAEDGAAAPTGGELREWLRERLPEHLVPAVVAVAASLPLNANGKVDRDALPPVEAPEGPAGGHVAPRTPVEEILAGIWADLLRLERVGADGDFFLLGGHSLLAMQAVTRVRDAFGAELPLRALFEAPTPAGLAPRVEAARGRESRVPPLRPIPRDGAERFPLSFAQQRLWLVQQMDPDGAAYNVPFALGLRGPLDPPALRRALGGVVRRHEVLRTTLREEDGELRQVVAAPAPVPLPVVDLGGVREEARAGELLRLAYEEAARPFDLARGPLLRASLVRRGPEDHVLLFDLHHVVCDGWSMQVLARELSALYDAHARGEEPRLPGLPVQYADFAAWQRRWLRGEALEEHFAYWRERLAGAPPLLDLPLDRPRPVVQGTGAASVGARVSPRALLALRQTARREGCTLFMTLLAAWQVLLARYAGQEDVVVGTPVAGRTRAEVEGLVGFFVNMLALRTDLSGDPAFPELLRRVRETSLGAFQHQDLPFERLVEELAVERGTGYAPLFQAAFALNPPGVEGLSFGRVEVEPLEVAPRIAKFDLEAALGDDGEWLSADFIFRTDLFERATVVRLAEHFGVLLEGIAADPSRAVSALPLLAPAERTRVLEEWNATSRAFPADTVPALFAARAARAPDAVAVTAAGESLTYAELELRGNRLAHHLRGLGVGPEVRVGLCVERGAEMVVGMLGILGAGGAYVPLDPAYPAERLAWMIGDAGLRVVVSQARLAGVLPPAGPALVLLDADRARIDAGPEHAPLVDAGPDALAYVIYTSGSTGTPKGVLVPHRAVARLVVGSDYVRLEPGDRVAQAANHSFDATTWEVWGALLNGGSVVVLARDEVLDPAVLARRLREERVTALFLTTALFNRVAQAEPGAFGTLRHLLFGGEAVDPERVRAVLECGPPERLLHVYGPTENTTFSSWEEVRAVGAGAPTVPIGRGIANTRLYVVDARLEAVPVGVPGELLVAGAGLARGYLNAPEPTAERWIPDPFSAAGGARAYRTGDRVRWTAAGSIEFLGRTDHQVKIRGFRIEPGEVEAVLARHPRVRDAVVVVREDGAGERRLVAYAAAAADGAAAPTGGELREWLRERLPEHLVPAVVAVPASLPLNPNGKVDRDALPPVEALASVDAYVAPRTPVEEILAGIWGEVLGVERVGVEDDFFELGGHSLLVMQVVARVRGALRVELPLRTVFEAPTPAAAARIVEALLSGGGAEPLPPVTPVTRAGPLPLSFAQQRLWLVDRLEPGGSAYNVPVALWLRGALEVPALRRSLREAARRHEVLRTRFLEINGRAVQVIEPRAHVPLPVVDLAALPRERREREARRVAGAEALRPFDLGRGPLLRAALVRTGADEHALLLTLHHIVTDGWSMEVLVREVSALYGAFSRGLPSPLPEPAVQYADYAAWQRSRLAGEVLERQLAYWRERLADAPSLLELPTDHPRGAGGARAGGDAPSRSRTRSPGRCAGRAAARGRRCSRRCWRPGRRSWPATAGRTTWWWGRRWPGAPGWSWTGWWGCS